jgi:sterol 3beta-glucosyltransferase
MTSSTRPAPGRYSASLPGVREDGVRRGAPISNVLDARQRRRIRQTGLAGRASVHGQGARPDAKAGRRKSGACAIVTAGSRGDVAPFTGLGERLEQAGHQAAIAAHGFFGDLVRGCGLEHRLLPGDPIEMARARIAAPSPEDARTVFSGFLEQLGEGLIEAVNAGADVVLSALGPAPLSRVVAEGFAIPSIGTYLVPAVPTAQFPLPGWPHPGDLGPAGNLAAGRDQLDRAADLHAESLPRLRARLGLPSTDSAGVEPPKGWPICHGFSPTVVPRPDDWPPEVRVTGYWWPARPTGWQPPAGLCEFLEAGAPPVFIGFGSMAPPGLDWLTEVVTAAVADAGVRAVVQAGWAGLAPVGDDIMLVGDVPQSDPRRPRRCDPLVPRRAGLPQPRRRRR